MHASEDFRVLIFHENSVLKFYDDSRMGALKVSQRDLPENSFKFYARRREILPQFPRRFKNRLAVRLINNKQEMKIHIKSGRV